MQVQSALIDKAKAFRAAKPVTDKASRETGTRFVPEADNLVRLLAEEAHETDTFLLAAALLHDVLQTTETTEAELASVFGSEIAFIVAEVTDNPRFSPVTRKALRLLLAPQMSRKARLIMLAAVIDSVRTLASPIAHSHWSSQTRHEYFDWAERLVEIIGKTSPTLQAVSSAEIESARLAVGSRA